MNIHRQDFYDTVSERTVVSDFNSETQKINQFEIIYLALNALNEAAKTKPTYRQVEKILQQILWPQTYGVIKTAEAICNNHLKKILESYMTSDSSSDNIDPKSLNIGDCLAVLLQLGELKPPLKRQPARFSSPS
jgi:hypothetical protein